MISHHLTMSFSPTESEMREHEGHNRQPRSTASRVDDVDVVHSIVLDLTQFEG